MNRFQNCWCLLKATLLLLISFLIFYSAQEVCGESSPNQQQPALQELIQKVKQNENLYQNLKLTLHQSYESPPASVEAKNRIHNETVYSSTMQGQKYRQSRKTTGRFHVAFFGAVEGPHRKFRTGSTENTSVYDGKILRELWQSDLTSITIGKPRNIHRRGVITTDSKPVANLSRPHMLLQQMRLEIPLSVYLGGIPAIREYQGETHSRVPADLKVRIVGHEKFQGLECTKVAIDAFNDQKQRTSGTILWLAQDRNLIPIRIAAFIYRRSEEEPVREGYIDEWQELEPGVWFPLKTRVEHYNLFKDDRPMSWQRLTEVKKIELNPKVKEQVFTTLDFPEGTEIFDEARLLKTKRKPEP